MKVVVCGIMTEDFDYDDLDDLLDEDPSKLEDMQAKTTQSRGTTEADGMKKPADPVMDKDDPAVKEMIEDLQQEFQNLMKQNGDGANVNIEDKEAAENFKKLLDILEEVGQVPKETTTQQLESLNTQTTSKGEKAGKGGFKDVISSTLDRLKENANKVDTQLEEEKKQSINGSGNPDEVLSKLLNDLVSDSGDVPADGEMDNAILGILNKMSSKEVLYQPMKDMQIEFSKWLEDNKDHPSHKDNMDTYKRQFELVNKLIVIYEKPDYDNDKDRDEVTELLDQLEQLGDSPVSKNFNGGNPANDFDEMSKMLNIDANDPKLADLDKDLADTCKQQ